MKRKGSKSDFIAERNKELRDAFFSQKVYSTTDRALEKVIKSPASRFWVDPDRARDVISQISKNPSILEQMYPQRKRMYQALIKKFEQTRTLFPQESKINCISMAIFSGAPEFFITPSAHRNLLYK